MALKTNILWEFKANRMMRIIEVKGISSRDGIIGEKALIEGALGIIQVSKRYRGNLLPVTERKPVESKTYCYFEVVFPSVEFLNEFIKEVIKSTKEF